MGIIFCLNNPNRIYDGNNNLTCDKKIFSETVSIISIFFSIMIVSVSIKKIKLNITNVLILQLIISEILDGLNILLSMILYAYDDYTFENYPNRMGICFAQIYIGVFSCLWNLFSSLFISLRIYDRMENKNRIFKNKFMYKYTTTLSYGIPCIISYIMWSAQVIGQSYFLKNKTFDNFYKIDGTGSKNNPNFRYMYCWVTEAKNYILFVICFLLIGANFYYSIFKNFFYMKKVSNEIEEKEDSGRKSIQVKIKKINKMKWSLFLYPVVSCIIWFCYFILHILSGIMKNSFMRNGFGAWLLIILISFRQFIFTFLFFWTQENIKKYVYDFITCKKKEKFNDDTEKKLLDD